MIYITKNQANGCVFTLNEKTTISNPNYLLELYSNANHSSKVLALSGDLSSDTTRYNKYSITEVYLSGESLSTAEVNLEPGTYDYFAWQATGTSLSLSAATSIVESGKLTVLGTGTTSTTYTNPVTEYTFE